MYLFSAESPAITQGRVIGGTPDIREYTVARVISLIVVSIELRMSPGSSWLGRKNLCFRGVSQ